MSLCQELPDPTQEDAWRPTRVPGQWAAQDPTLFNYGGSVWYRKQFDVPADMSGPHRHLRLNFSGVDYEADVLLNGKKLGHHEGYFTPFGFDITNLVHRQKTNLLHVQVNAGTDPGFPNHKTQIKGVFGMHDCRPGGDFAGAAVGCTGGIWNDVTLRSTGPSAVQGVHVLTDLTPDNKKATLHFDYELENLESNTRTVTVRATYGTDGRAPCTVEKEIRLRPGRHKVRLSAVETDPKLWWTWDLGRPDMYQLDTQLLEGGDISDSNSTRFGIRSVRLEDPTLKTSGKLLLNGKPVFQRGINYLPTEWLSTYDRAHFAADLLRMRDQNLNAVRVHCHVLPQAFYDEADSKGFLVWADFPMIWGQSTSSSFARKADAQYKELITRNWNHPSIFMWASHNEPYDYNAALDSRLNATAAKLDPTRAHMGGPGQDQHAYPGWYDWQGIHNITDINQWKTSTLPTEYGAQGIPRAVSEFIPSEDLWPIGEKSWAFHDYQPDNTKSHVGDPASFGSLSEFVDRSQKYQYDCIRYITEYFRRMKYQQVGGVYAFMWKDPWPSITWGLYDHADRPKMAADALRFAMSPLLLSIEWQQNRFKPGDTVAANLWAVNDRCESVDNAKLEWSVTRHGEDTALASGSTAVKKVDADSARCLLPVSFPIPADATEGQRWVLHAQLQGADGKPIAANEYLFGVGTASAYEPMYPTYPSERPQQ